MKTMKEIDTSATTGEEISRARKIVESTGNYWLVESSRDANVTYAVRWARTLGFTCECPAGAIGFSRCKIGVCAHVVIAVAAQRELDSEMARMSAAIDAEKKAAAAAAPAVLYLNGVPATAEELERIMSIQPTARRAAPLHSSKPFSILR